MAFAARFASIRLLASSSTRHQQLPVHHRLCSNCKTQSGHIQFPTRRFLCSSADESTVEKFDNKQKEYRLKQIEMAVDGAMPKLMKGSLMSLVKMFADECIFEDKVRGYVVDRSNFQLHVFKIRAYLNYKSAYKYFETVGTYICLDDNLVSLIWRLTRTKNVRHTYMISPFKHMEIARKIFIRKIANKVKERSREMSQQPDASGGGGGAPVPLKEESSPPEEEPVAPNLYRIEECLDIQLDDSGNIKRVTNRPVTPYDYKLAKMREAEREQEIDEKWKQMKQEKRAREEEEHKIKLEQQLR